MKANPDYSTHLCGHYHDQKSACPNLLYVREPAAERDGKKLKQFYLYCTAGGKCRSLGCVATFTGNSPTWCPKRIEQNRK